MKMQKKIYNNNENAQIQYTIYNNNIYKNNINAKYNIH